MNWICTLLYFFLTFATTGKVLVNCLMGMSRSSTCVLAYLMIRQNMTAIDALVRNCKKNALCFQLGYKTRNNEWPNLARKRLWDKKPSRLSLVIQ